MTCFSSSVSIQLYGEIRIRPLKRCNNESYRIGTAPAGLSLVSL